MIAPYSGVSVIMPWLDVPVGDVMRAVGSVIDQDYCGAIELILCNDGSRPALARSLERALQRQSWGDVTFQVIHSPASRGASAARNAAVRRATGVWLLWLDSDDELAPDAIREMVAAGERSGAGLVSSECWVIEDGSRVLRQPEIYLSLARSFQGTIHDPLAQVIFSLAPQMIRRGLFDALGGFRADLRWAEITELFLRFVSAYSLDRIEVVPKPLYLYYRRETSQSTDRARMEDARRRALLAYSRGQGLPIQAVWYVGRCSQTGAQHFFPIVEGSIVQPPYVTFRETEVCVGWAASSM